MLGLGEPLSPAGNHFLHLRMLWAAFLHCPRVCVRAGRGLWVRWSPKRSSSAPFALVFQSAPSGHKHLTVEELFGTSLPKEQPAPMGLESEDTDKLLGDAPQKEPSSFLPFPFEQSGGAPQAENLGVHSVTHHTVQPEVSAPVLITPASIAQSGDKHPPSYTLPLSPVLSPTLPAEAPTTQVPHLPRNSTMMQAVRTTPRQKSPLLNQPVPELSHSSLIASQSPFRAPVSLANTAGTAIPSSDLLQKLRLTPQHDQIQAQPLGKGAMAPNFSSAAGQLATPESFIEPSSKTAAARAAVAASLSNMVLAPTLQVRQEQEGEEKREGGGIPVHPYLSMV